MSNISVVWRIREQVVDFGKHPGVPILWLEGVLGHTHTLFSQHILLFLHWLLLSKEIFFFHESQEIAPALFA